MKQSLVVFDTNILFSALGWQSSHYFYVQMAYKGKIKNLTCLEILNKFDDTLYSKMHIVGAEDAVQAVVEIFSCCKKMRLNNSFKLRR